MRLCIRDKEKENVGSLFQDRSRLHKNYYQHKTVKVVDRMMMDVFLLGDHFLDILGRDNEGRMIRISEGCVFDSWECPINILCGRSSLSQR